MIVDRTDGFNKDALENLELDRKTKLSNVMKHKLHLNIIM